MRLRRVSGVSLIELLVVISMSAIVVTGAVRAFSAGIDFQTRVIPAREEALSRIRFEENIARLIRSAYISENPQDTTTYFIAGLGGTSGSGAGQAAAADTLIFTTLGLPPAASFLKSDADFEARNETFGPQGGAAEVQLSTFPVGGVGDRTGLFLREQRPSDGDPYQGGTETNFDDRVSTMSFEFWNGLAWATEWDTVTQGARRLPAAVRVTYAFTGEEETPHVFVVRMPLSDVTPDDPLDVGGTP